MKKIFLIVVLSYCISVWMFPANAEKTENLKARSLDAQNMSILMEGKKRSQAYPFLYLVVSIPIDEPETKEVIIDPLFIQYSATEILDARYLSYLPNDSWYTYKMPESNMSSIETIKKKYIHGKRFYAADHLDYRAVISQGNLKELSYQCDMSGTAVLDKWTTKKPTQNQRLPYYEKSYPDLVKKQKRKWYTMIASSNQQELLERVGTCKCRQEAKQWQWDKAKAEAEKYFRSKFSNAKSTIKSELKEYRIADFGPLQFDIWSPDLIATFEGGYGTKGGKDFNYAYIVVIVFGNGKTTIYAPKMWSSYHEIVLIGAMDVDKDRHCDLLIKHVEAGSEMYEIIKFIDYQPNIIRQFGARSECEY